MGRLPRVGRTIVRIINLQRPPRIGQAWVTERLLRRSTVIVPRHRFVEYPPAPGAGDTPPSRRAPFTSFVQGVAGPMQGLSGIAQSDAKSAVGGSLGELVVVS